MSQIVKAVVLTEIGGTPETTEVELRDPTPGEVQVAVRASGICHSDVSALDGTVPQPLPAILGHEGAGEIVAVGDDVEGLEVGSRVIVCWTPPCGACSHCNRGEEYLCLMGTMSSMANPAFSRDGQPYQGMSGTGTFAERLNLAPNAVVPVPDYVPFEIGALIGCGVTTGVGAAVNAAPVPKGSRVAVIGAGGVGISVIQGARIQGADRIVAIDMNEQKFEAAQRFGATDAVAPDDVEAVKQELTQGEGFDVVFDVVGAPSTIRSAYDLTRRGGTTCVVGVGRHDQTVEFNPFELFFMNRTLTSTVYGNARVSEDFPRFIEWWRSGDLQLDDMISSRVQLDDVPEILANFDGGDDLRRVITF